MRRPMTEIRLAPQCLPGLLALAAAFCTVFCALASIDPAIAAAQQSTAATAPPDEADPSAKVPPALAERLTPAQQKTYLAFLEARTAHDSAVRTYWRKVESKRSTRRAKRRKEQAFTADDYILTFPPKYKGPELPADIARVVAQVRPTQPEREALPSVADFLAHAKKQFGFVPKRATEREFKRSYASRRSRRA